jgi:hypothetical protein
VIGERTIDGLAALPLSSAEQDLEAAFVPSAALVGAAILSTLIYPFVGLALRRPAAAAGPLEAPALESG